MWLSTLCPFPSMHWGTYNQNGCIVCGMAFNIVAIFSNLVSCHFKMTLFLCLKQSCVMYQNLRYCVLLLLLLFCLNIIEQIKYKRKTVNGASFTSIKLVFASTENVTVIISRGCQVCGLFCVCCAPHVFPVTQFFPHVDCLIWFQVCLVFLPNYHVFKSPSPSVSVCWFLCVFPCVSHGPCGLLKTLFVNSPRSVLPCSWELWQW